MPDANGKETMQEKIARIQAEQRAKAAAKTATVNHAMGVTATAPEAGAPAKQTEPEIIKLQETKVIDVEKAKTLFANVPTMNEVEDLDTEHIILYGPPKTGKTLAFGLLAEFYNLLIFDGDKGLKTLYNILPKEMLQRIVPIRMIDTPDYPFFFQGMLKVVTGRKTKLCLAHGIHECPICKKENSDKWIEVELDTLPSNWIVGMDSQTRFVNSASTLIAQKANTDPKAGKQNEIPFDYKFQRDEWGALKNIMDKFGGYIKDLRCPFVSISHETMVETESGDKQLAPISGSDNSSKNYTQHYGSVVFTRVVNGKHTYSSASTFNPKIQAGTRSNIALEKQDVPALLHFFRPQDAEKLLKGSWTEWFLKGKQGPEPKVKDILPAE